MSNKREFAPILIVAILGIIGVVTYLILKPGTLSLYPSPIPTPFKINWDSYSAVSTWLYFNQNFKTTPERNFRFKYPKVFSIDNMDSGSVELKIGNEYYLFIEEFNMNVPGNSLEEKILYYYQNYRSGDDIIPTDFTELKLTKSPALIYKVPMKDSQKCAGGAYNKEEWYCYIGNYKKSGFAVAQVNEIPNDILSSLIESIEFK